MSMRSLYKSPLAPCIPNVLGGGGKSLMVLMLTSAGGPNENLGPANAAPIGLVEVKIGFSVE